MTTHIINVSGGKDSTAVYLRAIELGRPFVAVFADTGNEHELVYEYIDRLPARAGGPPIRTVRADFSRQLARHREYLLAKWPAELVAGRHGRWSWTGFKEGEDDDKGELPPAKPEPDIGDPYSGPRPAIADPNGKWTWLTGVAPMPEFEADAVVQEAARLHEPTGNPYLDLCISKGRFPSRRAQFCTEELKVNPIIEQVLLPALKDGPVLQWLGIRAEESANRAKQPVYNRHESGCYLWRPIFRWTLADVWEIHARHGVPRNPLYDLGMGRVGCMPCINCRKSELRSIADQFPEHIDRIERWEAAVGAANKRGASTFFPAVTDPLDADREGYAGIRTVVEWSRTARGGRQRDLFFQKQAGGGCNSDLALCEVAA